MAFGIPLGGEIRKLGRLTHPAAQHRAAFAAADAVPIFGPCLPADDREGKWTLAAVPVQPFIVTSPVDCAKGTVLHVSMSPPVPTAMQRRHTNKRDNIIPSLQYHPIATLGLPSR